MPVEAGPAGHRRTGHSTSHVGARLRQLLQPVRRESLDQPAWIRAAALPEGRIHVPEDIASAFRPGPAIVVGNAREIGGGSRSTKSAIARSMSPLPAAGSSSPSILPSPFQVSIGLARIDVPDPLFLHHGESTLWRGVYPLEIAGVTGCRGVKIRIDRSGHRAQDPQAAEG